MYIHTTTGVACTNLIGDVRSYGMVWYHTNGITNNLSLSQVKDQHPVTYDSRTRNAFDCGAQARWQHQAFFVNLTVVSTIMTPAYKKTNRTTMITMGWS